MHILDLYFIYKSINKFILVLICVQYTEGKTYFNLKKTVIWGKRQRDDKYNKTTRGQRTD